MKKNYYLYLVALIFLGMSVLVSCKKDDSGKDKDKDKEAEFIIVNPPPSSGEYWIGSVSGKQGTYWTQDFEDFKLYSSYHYHGPYGSGAYKSGDTLLLVSSSGSRSTVNYGHVSNSKSWKKVSSSKIISSLTLINGVLVVLSQDGNNFYTGYCNTNKGETSFTYQLLQGVGNFSNLHHVNHAVITELRTTPSTELLGYTRDGINWTVTNTPNGTYARDYLYKNNKTIFMGDNTIYYTSDTAYSNANWQSVSLAEKTADTSGYFIPFPYNFNGTSMKLVMSKWRYYGRVHSTESGKRYFAVNTSDDEGQTFTTSFLNGIPSLAQGELAYPGPIAILNNKIMFSVGYVGEIIKDYSSSDGINFTQIPYDETFWLSIETGIYFP